MVPRNCCELNFLGVCWYSKNKGFGILKRKKESRLIHRSHLRSTESWSPWMESRNLDFSRSFWGGSDKVSSLYQSLFVWTSLRSWSSDVQTKAILPYVTVIIVRQNSVHIFDPYNNSMKYRLFFPFYRWKHWCLERWMNVFKSTQLISDGSRHMSL